MKGKIRRAIFAVVGVAFVSLVVLLVWPRDPVFQGRKLSAWMRDLDGTRDERNRAIQSLRQMGDGIYTPWVSMLDTRA